MVFAARFLLASFLVFHVFSQNDPSLPKFPPGDPRNCLLEKGVYRFEVLPGAGWDNLRNQDMGVVFEKNYSKCKSSDDGKFLLPDNVFLYPVKHSKVEMFADIYDYWSNCSSLTAESINAEAAAAFEFGFSISGSYSSELKSIKEHQVKDNAVTSRVQIRHNLYKAKIQPDSALDPAFKSRLLEIASHLQHNNTEFTTFLAQLVVRDFGTHFITTANAGAILAKVDHLRKKYVSDFKGEKSNITAAASASFFASFLDIEGGLGYQHITEKKDLDKYRSNTVHSALLSFGGPPLRVNFSISQWENQMLDELVAIDRSGEPLHYAITPRSLPEISERLVFEVAETVKEAIINYYNQNKITGCTKMDFPNFSLQANFDDGSQCTSPTNNYTFGGVFQTCVTYGEAPKGACDDFFQVNPLTSWFSCPVGYEAVLVYDGTIPWASTGTTCNYCRLFNQFRCCYQYTTNWDTSYSTYWCVANGTVPPNKGYLFGGLYSYELNNPVTQARSCPLKFYPLRFGATMKVCVSDDYEYGVQQSVPFGGFFSCYYGNPLAAGQSELGEFVKNPGPPDLPRTCPVGYSQHLGAIENAKCEIHFCVKSNVFNSQGFPTIKRPPWPYTSAPVIRNYSIPMLLINQDTGQTWFKTSNSPQWQLATERSVAEYAAQSNTRDRAAGGGMGTGAAVGVTVVVTTALIGGFIAAVMGWRRRKSLNMCRKNAESMEPLNTGALYGAIGFDKRNSRVTIENEESATE